MLIFPRVISDLSYSELMYVYAESVRKAAGIRHTEELDYSAWNQAEQELYQYMKNCIFKTEGAFCAVWEENGRYISILRAEPYHDGLLITGLETASEYRGKGYARMLLNAVLLNLKGHVYSHIERSNQASIRVHEYCGFSRISNSARFLDGSFSGKTGTWHIFLE